MQGITTDNYFSLEIAKKYLDVSTFKDFVGTPARVGCEDRALARLNGLYREEKTEALLLGSLVDEMLTGTAESLERFKEENPQLYSTRGTTAGQLKSEYRRAEQMVKRAKEDKVFMSYLYGEHQKIMTGTLFGMEWRIKMDCYREGHFIADLKTCSKINDKVWCKDFGYNNIFFAYDYILQAAIYQEIVFQNTGKRLKFVFPCISKQNVTDINLIFIDDATLHRRIYGDEFSPGIANEVERIRLLMNGEVEPCSCGRCDYCIPRKKICNFMTLDMLDEVLE